MKNEDKKWEIIFSYADGGSVFLTDKQYKRFQKGLEQKLEVIQLDDIVLTPRFILIRPNPDYFDRDRWIRTRLSRSAWDEYQQLKKQGVYSKFEDYLKDYKPKLKERYIRKRKEYEAQDKK